MADCLARDSYMLTQHNRDEVTGELLGIEPVAVHKSVSDLPEGSDNRALVIALALELVHWKLGPARTPGGISHRCATPAMTESTTGTP